MSQKMMHFKIDEKEFDRMIEVKLIRALSVGSEEYNYKLLKSLPAKIEDICEILQKKCWPVYRRVNQLLEAGLVKREKGLVSRTEFADTYISFVDKLKEYTKCDIYNKNLRDETLLEKVVDDYKLG